jgi:alpha-mannosidase
VCEPEEHVPPLVEAFNQQPDAPFTLHLSTPMEYEACVAKRGELPIVTGELNPIFQGAYSSRILLKQYTREIEQALLSAEKLGTLLPLLGQPVADAELWSAWEPMLFNHTHDLMSGVMTDHVYTDTLQSYNFSRHLAHEQVEARLQQLSACIDTRGEGIGVMVMNPLGWTRSDLAVVNAGFSAPGVIGVSVTDPDGKDVPCQILDAQRDGSGALLQAKVAFIAREVPALGYALYRLHAQTTPTPEVITPIEGALLENEHYRVEFDSHSGAITRLLDKATGWDVLSAPGNVVVREPDHGDLWEPYHPLDGGSRIAMTMPHPPPAPGAEGVVFSTGQPAQAGQITTGPVVSTFTIAHPLGAAGQFQTEVRLYAGLRRIDIHTRLLNDESFVRYRALFPANLQDGRRTHEIPFGASEQPDGIEFPTQNWLDYGDGKKGLAVLNRGLPGNNVAGNTLMLSLLRSSRIVAYGFGGGYEPGMTSDTGLELGQSFDFDYALLPHAGNWQGAGIHRAGLEFNTPLLARTTTSHAGMLPGRWGLLGDLPSNVVVSALKSGPQGSVVLRLYEATGQPAHAVRVRFTMPIVSAQETNLLEDEGTVLPIEGGALQLDLRPFEIKTLRLQLQTP